MWPENCETTSPSPDSCDAGRSGRARQTSETRLTRSIQIASGGPSRGSVGRRIGKPVRACASSRLTGSPNPRFEPGGPLVVAVGVDAGVGDGDPAGDPTAIDGAGENPGVGEAPGPNTIRRPGSPNPIAPAMAA